MGRWRGEMASAVQPRPNQKLQNKEFVDTMVSTISRSCVRASWINVNNCPTRCEYIQFIIPCGAKRTHVFQIIVTLFIFNIKNYVNTKTTCNKCSFDYLHWLLNYGKLYRKDGVLLAVHTSGASPQSSASHLVTFFVAQLQFLREWKLSDRQLAVLVRLGHQKTLRVWEVGYWESSALH